MAAKDTHNEVMHLIGRLEGIVDTGFKGINNRLDTLNGKVAQAMKDIAEHDKQIALLKDSDHRQDRWAAFTMDNLFKILTSVAVAWILWKVGW